MSSIPRSVLVAVDFGEASARAVAVSGFIAGRCGAPVLRLLHAEALEAPPYFTRDQFDALARQRLAMRAEAERFLARFGRQHTSHPFTTVVDDRAPVDAILHESIAADLVVMGTHGRHGPKRWWLGSVAERVLRQMTRPLLVVRAASADSIESLFGRVLVHASSPIVAADTLAYARQLTACFGGEVVDRHGDPFESALEITRPSALIVASPLPRTSTWLSGYGEPLVRSSNVPILFVPENHQGASA